MQAARFGIGTNSPAHWSRVIRFRAGERFHRNQRHGHQQRQCHRRILTPEYLAKVAAIAESFRPYGVRSTSPPISPPPKLGGLPDADPLNPAVIDWWKKKADEIYA